MNAKILLCLPLVLTGAFMFSRAARASVVAPTNSSIIQIVNPQDSVELPKLGHAIFMEQSSGFSLQVPVGFRENGKRTDTNNPVLQAWLLKTDGTAIAQSGEPSIITMGSFGNYSTDFMFYQFSKVPENELSGVAVSVNGKLFCREIERTNIIATMGYTNWFWFSPDGFISGYAIQKGDDKVLKWSLWQ